MCKQFSVLYYHTGNPNIILKGVVHIGSTKTKNGTQMVDCTFDHDEYDPGVGLFRNNICFSRTLRAAVH